MKNKKEEKIGWERLTPKELEEALREKDIKEIVNSLALPQEEAESLTDFLTAEADISKENLKAKQKKEKAKSRKVHIPAAEVRRLEKAHGYSANQFKKIIKEVRKEIVDKISQTENITKEEAKQLLEERIIASISKKSKDSGVRKQIIDKMVIIWGEYCLDNNKKPTGKVIYLCQYSEKYSKRGTSFKKKNVNPEEIDESIFDPENVTPPLGRGKKNRLLKNGHLADPKTIATVSIGELDQVKAKGRKAGRY